MGAVLLYRKSIFGIPRLRTIHWFLPVPRQEFQHLGLSWASKALRDLPTVYPPNLLTQSSPLSVFGSSCIEPPALLFSLQAFVQDVACAFLASSASL